MDSSNPSELAIISLDDGMNRRDKNRERQRRYREKKCLRTRASQSSQIIILPTDVPVVQAVTRIYCKRDWKKDARRVYAVNPVVISNGNASIGQTLAAMFEVPLSGTEVVRRKLGRRNWKAEARAKMN